MGSKYKRWLVGILQRKFAENSAASEVAANIAIDPLQCGLIEMFAGVSLRQNRQQQNFFRGRSGSRGGRFFLDLALLLDRGRICRRGCQRRAKKRADDRRTPCNAFHKLPTTDSMGIGHEETLRQM